MEEAKKKLREIFAGYDYDIPEEVKLNLIKEWQKDLDKIKELEKKLEDAKKDIKIFITKSNGACCNVRHNNPPNLKRILILSDFQLEMEKKYKVQ